SPSNNLVFLSIGNNLSDDLWFLSISFYQLVVPFLYLNAQKSAGRKSFLISTNTIYCRAGKTGSVLL
ncbi:hypothetical protein, partial [Enterococcus plantarum]|uniref:hypothetical protein n=1 Tax=Enterococcus plantarum TaxID=1077675 RepID=UPI001C647670